MEIYLHEIPTCTLPAWQYILHAYDSEGVDWAAPFDQAAHYGYVEREERAIFIYQFMLLNTTSVANCKEYEEDEVLPFALKPEDPCMFFRDQRYLFRSLPGPIRLVLGPLPEPTPEFVPHEPDERGYCRFCDLNVTSHWQQPLFDCPKRRLEIAREAESPVEWIRKGRHRYIRRRN